MEVSHCIKYLKTGHQAPLNFQKGKPCPFVSFSGSFLLNPRNLKPAKRSEGCQNLARM